MTIAGWRFAYAGDWYWMLTIGYSIEISYDDDWMTIAGWRFAYAGDWYGMITIGYSADVSGSIDDDSRCHRDSNGGFTICSSDITNIIHGCDTIV